jgi:hypothetical protein
MSYGFVYFLTNPSMPGLTKIGMTTKHPRERMVELSKVTACPTPFEMLAFFAASNPQKVERTIHAALEEYRVSKSREFFDVPCYVLEAELDGWRAADGVVFREPLDKEVEAFFAEELAAINANLAEH